MKAFAALCFGLIACACVAQQADTASKSQHWVGTWATSQQAVDPPNQPGVADALLTDTTVRQVVHVSLGGDELRLELSNTFGSKPLTLDAVHLALPAGGAPNSAIDPATDHAVTFAGASSVTIPAGAVYFSDPVAMSVPAVGNVTISFHMPDAPDGQTAHPGSRTNSWLLHGEHTGEPDLQGATKIERWFQIASIDVAGPKKARAVVAFGDSITDGHASTTDGNDRWPDVLARRLHDAKMPVGVLNEGIGGNHLLTNGLGENALARMDRDVLAQNGVKYVMLFEGINDVGMLARRKTGTPEQHKALVAKMIAADEQIIFRAHAHALKVIGCTITPFVGSDYYAPTAADEAVRVAVNDWIRQPGHFDAVVDFDKAVRDPADPTRLLPADDSGDHLHPGPKGYEAMGDAIPLSLFR
jgi:lysophospholipase L1-like esterase